MKKTTIILFTFISFTAFSKDANQLKEAALKACEVEVAGVPEDVREMTKKLCECKVEKTDYAAVLEAQQSGDAEKVRKDALDVAAACAKKQE